MLSALLEGTCVLCPPEMGNPHPVVPLQQQSRCDLSALPLQPDVSSILMGSWEVSPVLRSVERERKYHKMFQFYV